MNSIKTENALPVGKAFSVLINVTFPISENLSFCIKYPFFCPATKETKMPVFIKAIVAHHHFDALRALIFELNQRVLLLKNRNSTLKMVIAG